MKFRQQRKPIYLFLRSKNTKRSSVADLGGNLTPSRPRNYNLPHPISLKTAFIMKFCLRKGSGQTRTLLARVLAFVLLTGIVHAVTFGSAHSHDISSAREAGRTANAAVQFEQVIPGTFHRSGGTQECLICLFHQQLFNSFVHSPFFVGQPSVPSVGTSEQNLLHYSSTIVSRPIARLSGRAPPRS